MVSFVVGISRNIPVAAATNNTINFQARLLTSAGNLVPDGFYNVEFKLYSAATVDGGETPIQGSCTTNPGAAADEDCVWVETREGSDKVRVANGYLTVNLGSVTAFGGSINWDQELWLTMNVGGTGTPTYDGEMSPRLKLTAVPYALRAGKLVGGSGSNVTVLDTGTPSGTNTISLPAESGTLCIQNSANCGFVTGASTNFIQNQNASAQATANFWISGIGRVDTALQGPAIRPSTNGTTAIQFQNAGGTATAMSIDTTNNRVSIGNGGTAFAPQQALDVIGNVQVRDAATANKAYRLRTSGTDLDFESAGAKMYISNWTNADYTGTQRTYIILENASNMVQAMGAWHFRTAADGTTRHLIDGTSGTSVEFNQNGEGTNFSVRGDTEADLFFVQGSTDRVGIGTNTPGYKLDVDGTFGASGNVTVGGTYNTNTFTSSGLQFGASSTAVVQSAASQALTITGHAASTWSTDSGQLTINGAAGVNLLGGSSNITIGTADGTPTHLVLDSSSSESGTVAGSMYYNTSLNKFRCYQNAAWVDCINTAAAGVTAIGTMDSQAKSANGAVISGTTLYLQTADASNPGLVSTGAQTIAGAKTLTGATLVQTDSASAFRVQSAGGSQLFGVDTLTPSVAVGATGSLAVASTVSIGTSTGATQTINIGGSGGSAANGTVVTIQGGNGAGAVSIQALASGTISLGTVANNQINLGGSSSVVKLGSLGTATANATAVCRDSSTTNLISCDANTTGRPFLQDGNSFGATGVLGTNDSNSLQFETNNVVRGTFDTSNNFYFGNGATAATPNNFTVSATGSTTAGTAGANLTLQGGGGASTTTGSAGGNITVQGGNAGGSGVNAGGVVTLQGGSASSTGAAGKVLVKNAADSATAFQVQNALGNTTILNVDTTNSRVGIGTNAPARTLDIAINNSTVNAPAIRLTQAGTGDATVELATPSTQFYLGVDASDNIFKISSQAASAGSVTVGYSNDNPATASQDHGNPGLAVATKVASTGSAGTLSSISIYIGSVSLGSHVKLALYADNGTGLAPGNLIATSAEITPTPNSWNSIPVSASIAASTTYWIVYRSDDGVTGATRYATTGNMAYVSVSYASAWPSPFGTATTNTNLHYLMYMTYTISTATDSFAKSIVRVGDTGQTAFQNSVDSSAAFQIQNASGTSLFNVNTSTSTLTLGTSAGSSSGLVVINTPTFTTASTQNCSSNCTITQANVDSSGAVIVNATNPSLTVTLPDPTLTTAGRIVYVTAANGSNDFTLSVNGGGSGNQIAMRQNTTATMIWSGSDWTAAGASSSTTLQAAYDNTLASAGGAEIVLNNTATSNGLTIRNGSSNPIIGGGLLEVQTSIGTNLFSVNNNISELVANGGAEDSSGFATNWTSYGTATITRNTTSGQYATGAAGAQFASTTANSGIRNNLATNPAVSTNYLISFTAKLASGSPAFTDMIVEYSPNGGTTRVTCIQNQTIVSTDWARFTCEVNTGATSVTNADILIYQVADPGAPTRTVYIDNLSMTLADDAGGIPNNVQIGGGIYGGAPTLFTLDRSSAPPVANGNQTYLGSMYYDTTTGRIQCYEADGWGACGSSPDNIITLTPEYTGAVLNGTGIGTMTADFCANQASVLTVGTLCSSGEARNFYKWTSPQATQQTYSIYVTYKLPSTFKNFNDNNTITLTAQRSDSNAAVTYEVYKSTGSGITACGSETTVTTSDDVWQTVSINGNENTTCAYAGGNYVIFKINVKANSNATAYVENLNFTYTNN